MLCVALVNYTDISFAVFFATDRRASLCGGGKFYILFSFFKGRYSGVGVCIILHRGTRLCRIILFTPSRQHVS